LTALRIVSVSLVLLLPATLRAGGFTIIELGSQKTGMMTGIGKPDDLSAVYHNPAGLASQHGTRIHLSSGFSFVDASFRLKAWESVDPENPDHDPQPGDGFYGSEDFIDDRVDREGYFVGNIKPTRYFGAMPMLVASSDFGYPEGPVVAFSVYVPDFIGAFLPEDSPARYAVVEGYFTAGVMSLSAGYRLPGSLDWLDVGVSAGLLYVRIEGKRWQNFPLFPGISDHNTDVIIRMVGEDYRPWWNAGVVARPLPGLSLGLSFIGGADVALKGRLDISLPEGWEDDPLTKSLVDAGWLHEGRFDMISEMKVPYGLSTGINYQIIEELEVAFDFRYWFYRTFERQLIHHNIDIAITKGEPVIDTPIEIPKEYEDSWTVSLGFLGRPLPLPLELMAGGTYDHSPAPSHTKSLDSPTVNLAGFSLGARYLLFDTWRFSLTYYHYWYLKDTIDDSILDPPQNAIFEGTVDTFSVQLEVIL
jgi:long-subunit fatty acid transport protein